MSEEFENVFINEMNIFESDEDVDSIIGSDRYFNKM